MLEPKRLTGSSLIANSQVAPVVGVGYSSMKRKMAFANVLEGFPSNWFSLALVSYGRDSRARPMC